MHVLMVGDVVGRPGRKAVEENVPDLIKEFKLDFVIANGENAAGGMGITRDTARELFDAGVDVLTMGNHVWNKKEIIEYIRHENRIIRPANYPPGVPGKGMHTFKAKNGLELAVINLSGRVFMDSIDCPFRKADQLLQEIIDPAKIVIVDFHAEATSEKMAMGKYLDGRVSAICGTHTHVQTADECILPAGTAYITDIGMTGPRDSIIGFRTGPILDKFITQMPKRFKVAQGLYQLNAVVIDIDDETGEAVSIYRIQNLE